MSLSLRVCGSLVLSRVAPPVWRSLLFRGNTGMLAWQRLCYSSNSNGRARSANFPKDQRLTRQNLYQKRDRKHLAQPHRGDEREQRPSTWQRKSHYDKRQPNSGNGRQDRMGSGHREEKMDAFEFARGLGIVRRPKSNNGWERLIKKLVAENKHNEAEQSLVAMRRDDKFPVVPKASMYDIILSSYAREKRATKAFKLYNAMKKHGVTPSFYTSSNLFTAAKNPDNSWIFEKLYAIYSDARLPMNTIACNALMSACNVHKQYDKTMNVLEWMVENSQEEDSELDVAPDSRTYTVAISALVELNDLRRALLTLNETEDDIEALDAYPYNAILKGYLRAAKQDKDNKEATNQYWESAFAIVRRMNIRAVPLNLETANLMMEFGRLVGDISGLDAIVEDAASSFPKKDVAIYNMMIRNRMLQGDIEGAQRILGVMEIEGFVPDIGTIVHLASGYGAVGDAKNAVDVPFSLLEKHHIRRNHVVYGALLSAVFDNNIILPPKGRAPYVLRILEDMTAQQVRPNRVIDNIIKFGMSRHKFASTDRRRIEKLLQG